MIKDISKLIALILVLLIFGLALILANANFVLASSLCIESDASICRLQKATLIKSPNNPEVYAIIENKKHKISNENIFLSYGYNWQDIKTVSQEIIISYPSVKLVKIEKDPAVYYINSKKNLKKPHPSAEVFLSYDNKWEDIITISEKDLASYNDAILVKTKENPVVYVLEGATRKAITSANEFESMGYRWEDIIEINNLDLESYSLIQSNEIKGANLAQPNNKITQEISTTPTNTSRETLNVSLSDFSSNVKFIADGSIGEFMEFNLENMQGETLLNGITISAFGIVKNDDIGTVYITDKDNNYFNCKTILNNKKARFIFDEPLLINEGEIKTLIVKASVNKDKNSAYKTIGFGIESAQDLMTDAIIYGQFPIKGLFKEIRSGEGVLGNIEINSEKLKFEEINPGAKNQRIASFTIRETSGNEDVLIEKIAFYLRGNIKNTDIINIDLVDDNRKIFSSIVWMQPDGKIEFNLTKNPIRIRKKSSQSISLQADIIGLGDKNFEFIINNNSDIQIIGAYSQVELLANIIKPVSGFSNLTIKKGSIFAYLDQASPDSLVAGSMDATLAIFEFKAVSSDIALKNFNLKLNFTGTPLNGNLNIINQATGTQLYSTGAETLNKQANIEINLNPAEKIKLGGSLKIKIQANIPENIIPDTAYSVILDKFGFDDLQSELYIVKFQEISSKALAVKKSALYITPEEIKNSYTAGSKNILIGQFTLQANYGEDIYLEHISVKSQEGYDEASAATGFYNFKINLGNTNDNAPLKIPIGFTFKRPYLITAGKSVTLKIYSDTYPTASGNNIALTLFEIDAYGKSSKAKPKIEGLHINSTPVSFSQLNLSAVPNEEFTENEVGCGKQIKIGSFKLKSLGEDITVKELTLETARFTDMISYQNGYANLKVKNGNRTLASILKPLPEFNVFKTSFTVKKGEDMVIDIYADVPDCCDCGERYLQIIMKGIESYGSSSKVIVAIPQSATSRAVKMVCDCEETQN